MVGHKDYVVRITPEGRRMLSKQKPAPPLERTEYRATGWTLTIPAHQKLNVLDLMIHPKCKCKSFKTGDTS